MYVEGRQAQAVGLARPKGVDRGAGLAEFAVLAPVLLILLFGIIEFGIALNRVQAMEAAAREGARLASISSSTEAEVDARVIAALAGIPLANISSDVTTPAGDPPCQGNQGDPVRVEVEAEHTITIPLLNTWNLDLETEAVFRCEA